jgi:hypothetical protein
MNLQLPQHYSGIPTLYNGVRFRSRLEARWAVFFDAVKWPWTYEPYDLNGYIPDFVLDFDAGQLLAEVKPGLDFDALREAVPKLERSGWRGEAVILGADLIDGHLGLFGALESSPDGVSRAWGEAWAFFCTSCGQVSLLPPFSSWACRRCGADGGNAHVGHYEPAEAWAEAGNRVQWRPRT